MQLEVLALVTVDRLADQRRRSARSRGRYARRKPPAVELRQERLAVDGLVAAALGAALRTRIPPCPSARDQAPPRLNRPPLADNEPCTSVSCAASPRRPRWPTDAGVSSSANKLRQPLRLLRHDDSAPPLCVSSIASEHQLAQLSAVRRRHRERQSHDARGRLPPSPSATAGRASPARARSPSRKSVHGSSAGGKPRGISPCPSSRCAPPPPARAPPRPRSRCPATSSTIIERLGQHVLEQR